MIGRLHYLVLALSTALGVSTLAASLDTSDANCVTQNANHYDAKTDVWVSLSGIPPGTYVLTVTFPGNPADRNLGKNENFVVSASDPDPLCFYLWDNVQQTDGDGNLLIDPMTMMPIQGFADSQNPAGVYKVTIRDSGNLKKSDNIKIGDSTTLGLICASDITVQCENTAGGTAVNFPAPTISGGVLPYQPITYSATIGGQEVSVQPGSLFPCGTTTVTASVTDSAQPPNTATCSFTVTVEDTEAPVINADPNSGLATCPADLVATAYTTAGVLVPLVTPVATDNCDLNPSVVGVRSDGQPLDAAFHCCTTTIVWTATDSCGNASTCTQRVVVTCVFAPGGHTLGFWSNRNGQALEDKNDLCTLRSLNLRNGTGADFDPISAALCAGNPTAAQLTTARSALASWLLSANATSMAYMLSAQLAATELSVLNGFTDPNIIVDVRGGCTPVTVAQEIAYANSLLANPIVGGPFNGQNGSYTKASSALRIEQERVKNILDKINNGLGFVQPCNLPPCQ